MLRPSYLFIACLSALFILSPGKSDSANFTVSPIRLFFDGQKTNVIQVTNNSDEKLPLELSVYAWAQDEDAKDVFSPTQDIIFFPRMLTLAKEEERMVRVGLRTASGDKEKTYRIYFEEMPGPSKQEGATIRTLMRAGVPIFVAPRKAVAAGAIEGAALSKGSLSFSVRNNGNVHFVIKAVNIEGTDKSGASLFKKELSGWYLLEGRSRKYSTDVPAEACQGIKTLNVDVTTDRLSMTGRVDVSPQMCPQ